MIPLAAEKNYQMLRKLISRSSTLSILLAFLPNALSANEAQTITNTQGQSITALILNKSDSQILVERDDGYRFKIEKSQLDDATTKIIEEWESPINSLLVNLKKADIFKYEYSSSSRRGSFDENIYSKRAFTYEERLRKEKENFIELMNFSKKYGEYREVNDAGYREAKFSLWSILESISEGEFEGTCARVISSATPKILERLSSIEETWSFAEEKHSDLRKTFQGLRLEIGKNALEMDSRRHSKRHPVFFISEEVSDLSKLTMRKLSSIQEEIQL